MSKNVAVILSGCGVFDGAEIHESVLTLLALDQQGATVTIAAADMEQTKVVNHLTNEESDEKRNVLVESARIARGAITNLKELDVSAFDAVVFPGGFGAALNSCDFALKGPDCSINPEVERVLKEAHSAGKVIGAMCIAPTLIAKALGSESPNVTIGNAADVAGGLEALGAKHSDTEKEAIVVDEANKIVTNAAYMYDVNIASLFVGIDKLVKKVLELA